MAVPAANPESRRTFLQMTAGAAVIGGLYALGGRLSQSKTRPETAGASPYGPLALVNDENTGLPLIKLPTGSATALSVGRRIRFPMAKGTPNAHDGMAAVKQIGSEITLIRNHERSGKGAALAGASVSFDPAAPGGCTTLVFDAAKETLVRSFVSLSGTVQNCAGGATPWGTWLSCEETLAILRPRAKMANPPVTPEITAGCSM